MERSGRVLTIGAAALVTAGGGLAMMRDGGAESSDVVDAADVTIGSLTAHATLEVQPDSEGTTGQGWRLCLDHVPGGKRCVAIGDRRAFDVSLDEIEGHGVALTIVGDRRRLRLRDAEQLNASSFKDS